MPGNLILRAALANATSAATLQSDFQDRISGPGVVWYHDFNDSAEVDAFRWSLGYGSGNDPQQKGTVRVQGVTHLPTDGIGGGGCLQLARLGGDPPESAEWWRPFSPIVGAGNGRGVDDPGANGTLPAQSFIASDGGTQTQNWQSNARPGWYGHTDYHSGTIFDGSEFYFQMRVKVDPRRTASGNTQVGKMLYLTTTSDSLTAQEIVTYSGAFGVANGSNYHNIYTAGSPPLAGQDSLGRPGNAQIGSQLANYALGQYCDYNDGTRRQYCWAWSGGWDTVMYRMIPGHHNTQDTRIIVYAAHEGETSYTIIWDEIYTAGFEQGNHNGPFRNGWNGLILSIYNNGQPNGPFWCRYDQLIFSKQFINCPQVYGGNLASWASSQTDKAWVQPLTTFTTLDSVKPSLSGSNWCGALDHARTYAWSSGCVGKYNGHIGQFHMGGGHNDYPGNEVYFRDLEDLRTYRIKDPSLLNGGDITTSATVWGDGNPIVGHTYRHITYTPGGAKGLLWMTWQVGSKCSNGGSADTLWRLNLATGVWDKPVATWPGSINGTSEGGSFYSVNRNKVYVINQAGQVWSFTPGSGSITASQIFSGTAPGNGLGNGLAYWDNLGLLLYRSDNNTTFSALNVDNPAAGWTTLTVSGTFLASDSYPGMVWHERSKKFLCWGHSSNRANIHTLAPANPNATSFAQAVSGTWVNSTVAPAGGSIVPPDMNSLGSGPASGVFKHFDLIPNLKGSGQDWLILSPSTTDAPYLYKLPVAGV